MFKKIKNIVKSWGYGANYYDGKSRVVSLKEGGLYPLDFISHSYNERNFREFICVAFGENPYINMIVPRITNIQSSMPRSFKDENNEIVDVDQNLKMLIEQPNRQTDEQEFYDKLDQFLRVTGNAIVYGIHANPSQSASLAALGMSRYKELHIASIADTKINTTNGTEYGAPISYTFYHSSFNDSTITIDAKDVLHIKDTNIISSYSNYGLSPLFGQQKAYTASTMTFESRVNSYINGGATGVLSPKGSESVLMPKERKAIQKQFTNDIGGTHNFGSVYVTNSPVDFSRITISPEQLKLIESLPLDLRIVCGKYDVDSVLFSDVSGTTFNNLKTAQERIKETATRGGLRIDKRLSKWLIQKNYGLQGVKYSIDVKDQAQENKIEQRNTTEGKAQIIDISIAREERRISDASAIGMLIELFAYSEEKSREILGI